MKLEEVLPAYRVGKTIISDRNCHYQMERRNGSLKLAAVEEEEIFGEWEIEKGKVKVKKYPALLLKIRDDIRERHIEKYCISGPTFIHFDEAKKYFSSYESFICIRLVTEIPELIQEEEV